MNGCSYKKWKIRNFISFISTLKLSYLPRNIKLNRLIQEHTSQMILGIIIILIDMFYIIFINDMNEYIIQFVLSLLFVIFFIFNLITLRIMLPELKTYQGERLKERESEQDVAEDEELKELELILNEMQ